MRFFSGDRVCSQVFKGEYQNVYGLVLTALNPPPPELISFYTSFVRSIRESLDEAGINKDSYYLYDINSLHCTIATLHSFSRPYPSNPEQTTSAWQQVLLAASQSSDWPTTLSPEDLKLRLKAADVHGNGVGVLRYSDDTHTISSLRSCLQEYCTNVSNDQASSISDIDVSYLQLPDIVHSTVLRWRSSPGICVEQLQCMFDKAFSTASVDHDAPIPLTDVKLIRESEPYMRKWSTCTTLDFAIKTGGKP